MSHEKKDDILPLQPPRLVRTLSEHHWIAANIEMAQQRAKCVSAGYAYDWEYQVTRDSSRTRNVKYETFHKGKIISTDSSVLLKPQRCSGKSKDGRRCNKKVYWTYCKQHSPG